MANYLYNGVELPDINAVWTDKETYPYAYIGYCDTSIIAKGSFRAIVVFASEPYSFGENDGADSIILNGNTQMWECFSQEIIDAFGAGGEISALVWYQQENPGGAISVEVYVPIWTSHDILNTDGSVYLAASEPIPVGTAPGLDPLSLFMGWKAGNWVARQRGKKVEQEKTPVAYLYNGVRLPDINAVWTDEMKALYPYAYMYEVAGFGAYAIILASFEMYKDGKQIFAKTAGEAINAMYFPGAYDDWESDGIAQEVKANELMFDEEAEVQVFTAVSWTSHDILNADGTIYLAASEPVPVYE